jgi:hypothetical protein
MGRVTYVCRMTGKKHVGQPFRVVGPYFPIHLPKDRERAAALKESLRKPISEEGWPLYQESVAAFQEFESNCNTCRHLLRVPSPKQADGSLRASCGAGNRTGSYAIWPGDPMFNECWESRK